MMIFDTEIDEEEQKKNKNINFIKKNRMSLFVLLRFIHTMSLYKMKKKVFKIVAKTQMTM